MNPYLGLYVFFCDFVFHSPEELFLLFWLFQRTSDTADICDIDTTDGRKDRTGLSVLRKDGSGDTGSVYSTYGGYTDGYQE